MADATSALVVSAVSRCARSMLGPSRAIKLCKPDLDSAGGGVEAMPAAVFDGSGLLKVLSVKHPAAMLLYESIKGQEDEAGCSSTLLLSLVGPLMDRCSAMLVQGHAELHIAAGIDRAVAECESVMSRMVRAFGESQAGWEADAHGLARGRNHVMKVAVASLSCLLPRTFPPQAALCPGNEAHEKEGDGEDEDEDEDEDEGDDCAATVTSKIDFFSVLGPRTDATFLMEGVVVRGGEADDGWINWARGVQGAKEDRDGGRKYGQGSSDWNVGREAFRSWQDRGGGGQNVLESEAGIYGVGICLVKDGRVSASSSSSSSSSSRIRVALRERGVGLVLAGSAVCEQGGVMEWAEVSFICGVSLRDLVAVADDTGSAIHDDFDSFLATPHELQSLQRLPVEGTMTGHSNIATSCGMSESMANMPDATSKHQGDLSDSEKGIEKRGECRLRINAIPLREGWTSKHMTARGDRIRAEGCSPCIAIMSAWDDGEAASEERAYSRRRRRRRRRRCTVVSCGPSRVHVQGMMCAVSTCVRRIHNAVKEGVLPGGGRAWMAECEVALRCAASSAFHDGEEDAGILVSGQVMLAFADAFREMIDTCLASEGQGGGFYEVGEEWIEAEIYGCDDFLGTSSAVKRAADLVKHVLGCDCLITNGMNVS